MIVKIKEKATELIDMLDKYESELSKSNQDASQVFMAWYRANTMMSNIKKQYSYEKTNGLDREHRPGQGESLSE